MDLLTALILLGALQGLFLAGLLAWKADRSAPSNRFLLALLLVSAGNGAFDAARLGWGEGPWTDLGHVLLPLYGPLLLFHVRTLVGGGPPAPRVGVGHLLFPAFIALSVLGTRPLAWAGETELRAVLLDLPPFLAVVGTAVQAGLCLRWARREVAAALGRLDGAEGTARLEWVRLLLRAATAVWLAYLVTIAVGIALPDRGDSVERWLGLVQVLVTYGLGLLALVRPGVFLPRPAEVAAALLPGPKYAKSALAEEDMRRIAAKLRREIAREDLYQDPDLSLPTLAKAVGASPNDVSQTLNAHLGTSFRDFVNGQRVAEACRLLRDPTEAGRTVLEIGLAVGFNSKSAFNAAFKKQTGTTPTAWRDGDGVPARTGLEPEVQP